MKPLDRIQSVCLGMTEEKPGQWVMLCPVHNDHNPSLHLWEKEDGKVTLHCDSRCPHELIVKAWGLTFRDLFPENGDGGPRDKKPWEVFRDANYIFEYVDEEGAMRFEVAREEYDGGDKKRFAQRRKNIGREPGEDEWIYDVKGVRRLLLGLPDLKFAIEMQEGGKCPEPIFVVEGEKKCEAVRRLGFVATTNSQGSGQWTDEHTRQIEGARDVVLLPDNDVPGRKHIDSVAAAINSAVGRVRVLALPGLGEKGDVYDWILAGGTKEQLLTLAEEAPRYSPPEERFSRVAVSAPDFMVKEYPTPRNLLGVGIFCAGDLGLFWGKPGTGKTWLALQFLLAGVRGVPLFGFPTGDGKPLRVGIIELELHALRIQDRLKALGVTRADSGLYVVSRPDLAGRVDLLSDSDCKALEKWCRDDGLDLLIFDALSRIHTADENTGEMGNVLGKLDDLRHATGTAQMPLHHEPKTSGGGRGAVSDLDSLRGHSRLQSDPTFLLRLVKLPSGLRSLRFVKANNAQEPDPIFLRQRDDGILELTEPPKKTGDANRERVMAALQGFALNGAKSSELADKTGLADTTVKSHLAAEEGARARRTGKGRATRWWPVAGEGQCHE